MWWAWAIGGAVLLLLLAAVVLWAVSPLIGEDFDGNNPGS